MSVACIEEPECSVRLTGGRLAVTRRDAHGAPPSTLAEIPFAGLERVWLREGAQISSQAICALLRAGIPTLFFGRDGRLLGACQPAGNPSALRLRLQLDRSRDEAFRLHIARELVLAKIYNQTRLLQRLAAARSRSDTIELGPLASAAAGASRARNLDELRGWEGAASAAYFPIYATFLPEAFPFEKRMAHPPGNAVNACISYASAVIYGRLVTSIQGHGLDASPGCLHATDDRRWSLALDLMEPFRPCFVEAMTLRVLVRGMLRGHHFERRDGGVFLTKDGRGIFVDQIERRLRVEFTSEHVRHRTTLKGQLESAVLGYLAALDDPSAFRPFRMN